MHHDPRIMGLLRGHDPVDVDMWTLWHLIRVPRMVIHGQISDVLSPATFARMEATGAETFQIPSTGMPGTARSAE